MALPKEPRQKMINMMYIVLIALLALNVSAEVLNAFRIVDRSLSNSNNRLSDANRELYASINAKLTSEKYAERAQVWQPVAAKVGEASAELYKLLESYKGRLRMEADAKSPNDSAFREDNLDAASRLFTHSGEELFNALLAYKNKVLQLHPEMAQQFSRNFPLEINGTSREWAQKNFYMVPTVAALTILSKLQHDVKNTENQLLSFCDEHISKAVYIPDAYGAVVSQSANYLMPGDKLRIKGMVGAYSKASGTSILVNGKPVPLNALGEAEYEIPATASGSYSASVTFNYVTQEGKTTTETKQVNWTVGAPGTTAVMLDKMNVVYMGVPNPVTIAAGVGEDKISAVQSSQGRLTKTGAGKYELDALTTEGDMSITVNADGKTSTFGFRVKSLPPPTAFVNMTKEGPMSATSFRAAKGVRCELENALILAPFKVVSYEITGIGPNLPGSPSAVNNGGYWEGQAAEIANRAQAGNTYIIRKIMVEGPDKKVRAAANPVIVIKCT